MSNRGFRGGRGGRDSPRGPSPFRGGGAPRGRGDGGNFRGGQGDRGGGPRGGGGGFRGGRAPAEIFAENVPAVPDQRVSNLDALITAFKRMEVTHEMPRRPGFGTEGREIKLRANFFALRLPKDLQIYDYEVKIKAKDDGKGKSGGKGKGKGKKPKDRGGDDGEDDGQEKLSSPRKARIFDLLESSPECLPHMAYIAHDRSARLVSSRPLPQPLAVSVQYYEEGDNIMQGEYIVEIKFVREMNTNEIGLHLQGQDREYDFAPLVSALNLVLQKHALKAGAVAVGQNKYFFPSTERSSLIAGLEARRGYFMSVRPAFGTLMVNVNASFAAFYDFQGNLADAMASIKEQTRGFIPNELFVKLKVVTTHLGYRKTHTVFRVTGRTASQTTFDCKELGGKVSVERYFKEKYRINLRHASDLPVIDVGSPGKARLLPPEICTVPPNQSFRNKLNPLATAAMINVACNPPAKNANFITREGLPLLGLAANPAAGSTMANFGLSVNQEMEVTPARVLPPPRIQYKSGGPNVRDGGWNILDVRFRVGGTIASWAVLLVQEGRRDEFRGPSDPQLETFLKTFVAKCASAGMSVPQRPPTIIETRLPSPRDDPGRRRAMETIRKELTTKLDRNNKPSFVLVLLSGRDDYIYPGVKTLCDMQLGLQTVCMLLDKARKDRGQDQYFSNVALKVNIKMKGVNHSLDDLSLRWLKAKKTMLVGIDVTHPSPGSLKGAPSIAAVVANSNDTFAQFPVSFRLQANRNVKKDAEEMVQDLCDMMVERLILYRKNVKALPDRILVCRDGVSEGQYKLVLQKELPQILEAFKKLQFSPKLSIIVCGKRHHARFPATSKDHTVPNGNTVPGTVVDKVVTDIYNFDFYLQAHNGLQGTVRPTHYIVIYDENGFTADEVQKSVHNTSYLYARATKAVSLIPPAYYADLACERARLYLNDILNRPDLDKGSVSQVSGRRDEDAERLRVYEKAVEMWGSGINNELQETMFYI